MTDSKKVGLPEAVNAKSVQSIQQSLQALTEAVNLLQGTNDQDQRAVRAFEFNQRAAAIEARLKTAGF